MEQLEQQQLEQHQVFNNKIIKIEPSNNIFQELGKTDYTFEEALSELIDNSISAKIEDVDLHVELIFSLDKNTKKCSTMVIRDNASGIRETDIGVCISPAGKQTKSSLNEHGLGLKSSVSSLGILNSLRTKALGETGFKIEKFQWDLELLSDNFNFEHGTEIKINIEDSKLVHINKSNKKTQIERLKLSLGARYRYKFKEINLKISLKTIDGAEVSQVFVEPVRPEYYNPWGRINEPLIYKKQFEFGPAKALLTFGYSPKNDFEFEDIGLNKEDYEIKRGNSVNHPYAICTANQGLDLIMNNRVISFSQSEEIGLYASRDSHFNQIRGEIIFLEGFQTTATKNRMNSTEAYREILKYIKDYLTKNPDNKGPERNLLQNRYLKGRDSGSHSTERELVDDIESALRMPTSVYRNSEIIREFSIEKYGLRIDLMVENIPWEVKNEICTPHRISQLVTYMTCLKTKKGVLVASEFSTNCQDIIKAYKEQYGIEIEFHESSVYKK